MPPDDRDPKPEIPAEELDELQAAQEQLERNRASAEETTPPAPLGALLGAFPVPGSYPCAARCGVRVELPGVCEECARCAAAAAIAQRVQAWARTLPEHQRDATWGTLHELRRQDGGPRVTPLGGGWLTADRVQRIRLVVERQRRVVLLGPAGSGKSTLAAAHLRAQVERRPEDRIRYVAAASLAKPGGPGRPSPLELALSAEVLVLDDVGAELEGAQAGSGLAAQRIGPVSQVIAARFERSRWTLVTTGLERDAITALYGDRVARRMFEGAGLVRLGAQAQAAREGSAA